VDSWLAEALLDPDDDRSEGFRTGDGSAYYYDPDDDGLLYYPFDGTVSMDCMCVDLDLLLGYDDFTVLNPLFLEDPAADCGTTDGTMASRIFDDIDLIDPDTGFLTSPWNLEATDDMSLADNLGTGKVGIYYDVADSVEVFTSGGRPYYIDVKLYHTIYHHDALVVYDPHSGEAGSGGSFHTWAFQVELDDDEEEGLRAKFGGDEVDIEAVLTSEMDELIATIAATIVESQYTFKKIKQPTVDVRLFSAFEEGQKEETQTLSVTTTSTKTTY
jgi:hypothetical protein